jgi:hypothetical protein
VQLDLAHTNCPKKAKIAYKAAAMSKNTSPCSNVPLNCPICPNGLPAIWKYNLKYHITVTHPESSPDDFTELWHVGDAEKVGMKQRWTHIKNPCTSKGKKVSKSAMVVSEGHSSHLAMRCVSWSVRRA